MSLLNWIENALLPNGLKLQNFYNKSLLIFVALIISRHVGFSGYPDSSQLKFCWWGTGRENNVRGGFAEESKKNAWKALIFFWPCYPDKNFRKLLYFSLLLHQTAGTRRGMSVYCEASLLSCQEILASFNTNSTISGQLFAKREKKFSLRRLRFFSISLLNGVLHLGLYFAVQSKRKEKPFLPHHPHLLRTF